MGSNVRYVCEIKIMHTLLVINSFTDDLAVRTSTVSSKSRSESSLPQCTTVAEEERPTMAALDGIVFIYSFGRVVFPLSYGCTISMPPE
jgi:hypothetical protein